MRLLTATLIVGRTSLQPTEHSTTVFQEADTKYTFGITRITHPQSAAPASYVANLRVQGIGEPYTTPINQELSPTKQLEALSLWMVFVVEMTLTIRELTNA